MDLPALRGPDRGGSGVVIVQLFLERKAAGVPIRGWSGRFATAIPKFLVMG